MKTYSFELDDNQSADLDHNIQLIKQALGIESTAECLIYLIRVANHGIWQRAIELKDEAEANHSIWLKAKELKDEYEAKGGAA